MLYWDVKEDNEVIMSFNDELLALQWANRKNQESTRKYTVELNVFKLPQGELFENNQQIEHTYHYGSRIRL